jgi:hypothetical protein
MTFLLFLFRKIKEKELPNFLARTLPSSECDYY